MSEINPLSKHCETTRTSFSAYLDGAVSGRRMQTIASHLEACDTCNTEFDALRAMQRSLADLGMKLRLAISRENARRTSSWVDSFDLKWRNAIRPVLIQASAGFAGTILLVGGVLFLLGMVAVPDPVMANDEPLGALTAPHYLYSAVMPGPILNSNDSTIVVQAFVNSQGRVYDYKIVSGPEDPAVRTQIADQLLLSVFEPARIFGEPIRGQAVVTFSGISVQG